MLDDILAIIKAGHYDKALSILAKTESEQSHFEAAMQLWFNLAMKLRLLDEALKPLRKLYKQYPLNPQYAPVLKELLIQGEYFPEVVEILESELANKSVVSADEFFNAGFYARKAQFAEKALKYFNLALVSNITDPHEVYLNIALVHSELLKQDHKAIEYLEAAIDLKPDYTAALHNLANIHEQHGKLKEARSLFERLLELDSTNLTARARLSDLGSYTLDMAQQYEKNALEVLQGHDDLHGIIDLYYGLGKVFDDAKDYTTAWQYYVKANEQNKRTLPVYEREYYETLIEECRNRSITIDPITCNSQPIIICGMFRSGSTLLERIIGANSLVAMGGEIEFLHKHLFGKNALQFQNALSNHFASDYVHALQKVSNQAKFITDKRPENFMYLDVVKAMFPQAKIIWTQRNRLDNCLSAFFQRLGPTQNYATDLANTLHYYSVQERILAVWQQKFGEDIKVVNYDTLVRSPQRITQELFDFLGLSYNHEDRTFHTIDGGVKTASVWQVRKPLYQSSSGRIDNYREAIIQSKISDEFLKELKQH